MLAVILVIYIAHGWAIINKQTPWFDEVTLSAHANSLAIHGDLGSRYWSIPTLPNVEAYAYHIMPGYLVTLGGWMGVVGNDMVSVRAFSIFTGALGIVLFFLAIRRLTNAPTLALLATGVLSADIPFIQYTTYGRPDSLAFLLAMAALWSALRFGQTRAPRQLFFTHLFTCLAGLTHPLAGLSALAWVLITHWRQDDFRLPGLLKLAALALLGYLLPALAWLGYILQSPADFIGQFMTNQGHHTANEGNFLVKVITNVLGKFALAYGLSGAVTAASWIKTLALASYLALSATAFALALRQRAWRTLIAPVLFGGVSLLIIGAMSNPHNPFYLLYVLPWIILLAAWGTLQLWGGAWRVKNQRVGRFIALLILAAPLGLSAASQARWRLSEAMDSHALLHKPVVDSVLALPLQPQDKVLGPAAFFYGLGFEGRLIADEWFGYKSGIHYPLIIIDAKQFEPGTPQPAPNSEVAHAWARLRDQLSQYRLLMQTPAYKLYADPAWLRQRGVADPNPEQGAADPAPAEANADVEAESIAPPNVADPAAAQDAADAAPAEAE
ncbi:putative membrane protein-like protein [Magnetofaba australis IT-1]|uniref:Putative membrane protein-like protein n=1 Tax=Magnetofaba australis IT-1 TaxID=1434232 RepID=A0A1Y2K0L7_9PROT|nr:putative membrane protein-like protein [Magnetofaba australis IT-1]